MSDPTQLSALINLLDEPDDKTFEVVREGIFAFGKQAVPPLEKAWENSYDSLVHGRIEQIIKKIRQTELLNELRDWALLGSSDLLFGYILASKIHYPNLNAGEITTRIEQIRNDAWLELNDDLTALENVKVLNHILFEMHRFEGNRINLFAPSNQYINTLLETRKGSPISLGILYIILAQRLHIPIHGVNLPQHFILAYLTDEHIVHPSEQDILFYINPFNKGTIFTRREIDLFIRQLKLKPVPSFFTPCTPVDIIQSLLGNLILTYAHLEDSEKVEELKTMLDAIKNLYGE